MTTYELMSAAAENLEALPPEAATLVHGYFAEVDAELDAWERTTRTASLDISPEPIC